MQIIPAIDIIGGKCVRLSQGDYASMKTYNEDPLEVAKAFEDHGLKRLHLVDLDGAKEKRVINYKVLEKIAHGTDLHIDFGGGVQSDEDIKIAFEAGAKMVTGGSVAIKNPDLFIGWMQTYGPEKIVLGADVKDRKIAVSGWQEDSSADLFDFLEKYLEHAVKYVISTDVRKDGMLEGPAFELYSETKDRFPTLFLIASGGVSNIDDLDKLHQLGLDGVILGKAIYEGRITLPELSALNEQINN